MFFITCLNGKNNTKLMNFVYKKQKRELVLAEDDILDAQY